jgi:hypothetical protein
MRKWTAQNQEVDIPTHTLTALELAPAASKVLSAIHVDRPGTAQVVWFWGATGVATSLRDAGATPLEAGAPDAGATPDAGADATSPIVDGGSADRNGDGETDSRWSEEGGAATDASYASDAPANEDSHLAPTSGCSLALSDRDTEGAIWYAFAVATSAIWLRKRRE